MNSKNDTNQKNPPRMGRGGPRGPMVIEHAKDKKGTLKKLVKYVGGNKFIFFGLIFFAIIVALLNLAGPYLQGEAMDVLTISLKQQTINYEKLLLIIYLMIGVYVLTSLFSYFQGLFAVKLSVTTVRKMRNDLFSHIVKLPIKYIDSHAHGDIMSRMTNDVDRISNTISSSIASLVSGVLTIIGVFVIMITINWFLALISTVSIFLTIIVAKYLSKMMRKYYKRQQELLGELNGHSEETITGFKTVNAYNHQTLAKETFNNTSNELKKVGIKAQIWGGIMGPVMNIITNIGFLLVCGFGGYMAAVGTSFGSWTATGVVTVGVIAKFILYSKKFGRPVNEIANLWAQIQSSLAAAERVFEIIDSPSEVDEGKTILDSENVKGYIEFKDVNFGYTENKQVIKNFNLQVSPGEKIALVGATGSGKTTIVNLLMRFYDADNGTITIDGVNINDIPKDDLRKNVAIVLQDTVLFQTSIEENIKYSNPSATDEEMYYAAKMSNSSNFIEQMPNSYKTTLSEAGSNISQGQQQLLSIARAILANPKILILDEATSSVDTRTEKNIQDAMVSLMKNRTSLIIAHRLSTIQDADKIIVMDQGQIVEQGNHKELLAQKGKYYTLYQTQFAGNAI